MQLSKVCVIIVTYNGIQWIEKCLSSVSKSIVRCDILVVDNGSTDGTIEYLKQNSQISFLHESKDNLGFGKANNVALKYAYEHGYDYFFLLNQDAWIEKDVIAELTNCLQANPTFGIVSPMHYDGSGSKFDYYFEAYLSRTKAYQEDLAEDSIQPLYETTFVNAASWMISRQTIEKVGLFHPLFEHYGEDDNYIDRLHAEDLKLGIVTRVKIFHDRDTAGPNPIKDDPRKLFTRGVLQSLLKPSNSISFASSYQESRRLSKKLSRMIPLLQQPVFRIHCISEFLRVYNEVKSFNKNRQSELKVC